jgi:enamine deaminase RidA (YjgF/YER057c/UK114 family)
VFVAGQTALDLDGNTIGPFDIAVQTHAVFKNIETALAAVGAEFSSVCELTTYVVGIENRAAFQQARAKVFARIYPEGSYPPNTLLVISGLAKPEILIEISAIARLP